MLIYSPTKLQNPIGVNTIMLEDKDNHYYFVHRTLYDQAVILKHTYGENMPMMEFVLGIDTEKPVSNVVQYFLDTAPSPLNILAPFITLVEKYEDLPQNMRTLCGVLHVISRQISLLNYLKVDQALRASVTFSLSITEEFELDYERFFQESTTHVITVATATPTTAHVDSSDDADDGNDGDYFEGPSVDMSEVEEFRKMMEERASTPKAPAPAEPVVKSGFDALRGL